jgi:hypothetical protein
MFPPHGAGDHVAVGAGRANDAERLGEEAVPAGGVHPVVRLVEQLEPQAPADAREPRRNLLPEREEARLVGAVLARAERVEMMDVEHDLEASGERRLDRELDPREERRVEGVGPLHRQADGVEASRRDQPESGRDRRYARGRPVAVEHPAEADPAPGQKSIRMTARRRVGRETSVKPASAKVRSVPTWSSSRIAFLDVIG